MLNCRRSRSELPKVEDECISSGSSSSGVAGSSTTAESSLNIHEPPAHSYETAKTLMDEILASPKITRSRPQKAMHTLMDRVLVHAPAPVAKPRFQHPGQALVDALSANVSASRHSLSHYNIDRILGRGSFGEVRLGAFEFSLSSVLLTHNSLTVKSKRDNAYYALKVLNKNKVAGLKQINHTNSEAAILRNLSFSSPFIVNTYAVFQDATNLYLLMNFAPGGELMTVLRRYGVRRFLASLHIPLTENLLETH